MAGRFLQLSSLVTLTGVIAAAGKEVTVCEAAGPTTRPAMEQSLLQVAYARRVEVRNNASSAVHGYPRTGNRKYPGLWCEVDIPPPEWNLKTCPGDGTLPVKVLSYNLYWWNLFRKHRGGQKSAGRLIARTSEPEQYDLMAFQECDDRQRVLNDALQSGLRGDYGTIDGGRAIAIAYRKSRWTLLETDSEDVGEDSRRQYYGKRSVLWARFRHRDGKTIFFINHHGPLRVSEGGGCTGSATALNIMRVIAEHAHSTDAIILVGDFNAASWSSRIQEMDRRLNRVFTGHALGGIDHVFTNCARGARGTVQARGDGSHKSDHNALSATIKI